MEKSFDLLKLHDPILDKGIKSWICVSGPQLCSHIALLLDDLRPYFSKKKLALIIANQLRISVAPIKGTFYNTRTWHPLLVIEKLLELWAEKCRINIHTYRQKRQSIIDSIVSLKLNSSFAKPIKVPTTMTIPLAKLCGAHAADGWLGLRHRAFGYSYEFTIREKTEYSLIKVKEWIKFCFGLNVNVVKDRAGTNNYAIEFSNKIFVRFLHIFLDFPYGKKTEIVAEPSVIKNSDMNYRRAFALGVLTFDGYMGKRVELCVKSKNLRDAIYSIAKKDDLEVRSIDNPDKLGRWRLYSSGKLNSKLKKWLDYFEPGTEKYLRLIERISCIK